jgi:hypothetical protein
LADDCLICPCHGWNYDAAGWILAGAVLSCLGLIHVYHLSPVGIVNKLGIFAAPEFALSYAACAFFLVGCHFYIRRCPSAARNPESMGK